MFPFFFFFFIQIIMASRWTFWLDVVSILIPPIILYFFLTVTIMVVLCDGKLGTDDNILPVSQQTHFPSE